jgi:2-oxoglutarate ferredoxin oxidoreductase subunit alpha
MGGISWDPDEFESLYRRITGKIENHVGDIVETHKYFLEDAEIILIAYGSESRPALEATRAARTNGIKTGLLKLDTVWPVPEKEILEAAKKARKILSVEMNIGKYSREIERVCCSHCEVARVTKNRGLVHTTAEIYSAIQEAARS